MANFEHDSDKESTLDSADLWTRFKAGDSAALGKLSLQYYSSLFNYGMKFSKDKEFVRDCIQDLFFDLWLRREKLSETYFVKAYFLKALRNKMLKELQKENPVEAREDWQFEASEHQHPFEDTLILNEQEKEQIREVKLAVSLLTRRQQEIIYLRFFQHVDFDEIARIMNLTRPSVANLLSKTLKELKHNWPSSRLSSTLALWLIIYFYN